MARKWFQLVGKDWSALTSADAAVVDIEDVAALRDAVKLQCPNKLANVAAADLAVFAVTQEGRQSLTPGSGIGSLEHQRTINSSSEFLSAQPHPKQPFFKLFCRTFLQMLRQLCLNETVHLRTDWASTMNAFGERRRGCDACCSMLLFQGRSSHLFRQSNEYSSLAMMQISDIDDEKNGLLLFKPLNYALDHFQISFIRDVSGVFCLKLFDPSTKDTRIIDLKDRKGHDVLTREQTRVLLDSVSRAKKRCLFDVATTFGNVDGKPLVFTSLERPFYRCFHCCLVFN